MLPQVVWTRWKPADLASPLAINPSASSWSTIAFLAGNISLTKNTGTTTDSAIEYFLCCFSTSTPMRPRELARWVLPSGRDSSCPVDCRCLSQCTHGKDAVAGFLPLLAVVSSLRVFRNRRIFHLGASLNDGRPRSLKVQVRLYIFGYLNRFSRCPLFFQIAQHFIRRPFCSTGRTELRKTRMGYFSQRGAWTFRIRVLGIPKSGCGVAVADGD